MTEIEIELEQNDDWDNQNTYNYYSALKYADGGLFVICYILQT